MAEVDYEEVWKEAQSVLVSRFKANGVMVMLDEWPGMASSKFALESMIWKKSKRIFVDVDTAELSNLIGCISDKTQKFPLRLV